MIQKRTIIMYKLKIFFYYEGYTYSDYERKELRCLTSQLFPLIIVGPFSVSLKILFNYLLNYY